MFHGTYDTLEPPNKPHLAFARVYYKEEYYQNSATLL